MSDSALGQPGSHSRQQSRAPVHVGRGKGRSYVLARFHAKTENCPNYDAM